ncbi:MAG: transporter [Sulfurovum sp.]|nr:MAG: transporter [Sulfurovum sp.]
MNQIRAKVVHIKNVNTLHSLTFSLNQQVLQMLSLELNPNIKVGTVVYLGIKSTHVAIAKDLKGQLSLENRLKAKVLSIENGEILSSVCLDIDGFTVESIIGVDSIKSLNLQVDDRVLVLINASDISILLK